MPNERDEKLKLLKETLNMIEKTHGKGSIMRLGDAPATTYDVISTGSISLDYALGIGGVPRGRIIEIFGPESSGKTTTCLHIIAEAQKNGGIAALIDAEHAFDINYARRLGVNTEDLILAQPDFGEQALEILDSLIRSNAIDVIVIDSVAALVPRAEIEGDMGDAHMAVQARLMSQALRKITGVTSKSNTCVIFTNQLRSKIGVAFGNPETTTGGNALKFYASVRLDIRRIGSIKEGNDVVGNRVKVKVLKSKVAPPFKEVEFDIMFNEGISKTSELVDLGVELGLIQKSGAWLSFEGERFQGREQMKAKIKEEPTLMEKLDRQIKLKLGLLKEVSNSQEESAKKSKSEKAK